MSNTEPQLKFTTETTFGCTPTDMRWAPVHHEPVDPPTGMTGEIEIEIPCECGAAICVTRPLTSNPGRWFGVPCDSCDRTYTVEVSEKSEGTKPCKD